MTIAAELVAAVERVAGRLPLPRVRAVHLPPPSADGTRAGEFCALELFLEAIATGATWGKTSRKTAITRGSYPGLDALLARAAGR